MKCNFQILPEGGYRCSVCKLFSDDNNDKRIRVGVAMIADNCAGQTAPCCGGKKKATPMGTPHEPPITKKQVQAMRKHFLSLKAKTPKLL